MKIGNGTNVLRIAPNSAFEFFFYELYKNILYPNDFSNSIKKKFICGGIAGMTAASIVIPFHNLIRLILLI